MAFTIGCVTLTSTLVLTVLFALTIQVFYFSPIDPLLLEIPPSVFSISSTKNNKLQNVIKLGEGFMKQPEDVCVDKDGVLYTATRDGWIKRLVRNGKWENWKYIDSSTLLGITTSKDGGLIVCDTSSGLLKVTEEDGFSVILSQVNGSQLMCAAVQWTQIGGPQVQVESWTQVCSRAMADLQVKQVLHFPNSVSRGILANAIELNLISEDLDFHYRCPIKTSNRTLEIGCYEKHIGDGWCRGDFRTPSYWLALVLKNIDSPPNFNLSKGREKDRINP